MTGKFVDEDYKAVRFTLLNEGERFDKDKKTKPEKCSAWVTSGGSVVKSCWRFSTAHAAN